MLKVLSVFGTRPEAIKMAPVIKELEKYPEYFKSLVCVTAQHRHMLDQVLNLFRIVPDYDLNIMKPCQDLTDIACDVLQGLKLVLQKESPDIVLVHGDTSTTMATCLAAYFARVRIGHIEAGLRTGDKYAPFPEEMNRRVAGTISDLHFAPTFIAKDNLVREGVCEDAIVVTGNTVIDSLISVSAMLATDKVLQQKMEQRFSFLDRRKKLVLVTGHRRENFGSGFDSICCALADIAAANSEVEILYPVHLNPNVQEPVQRILGSKNLCNVHLIEPVDYLPFVYLMNRAYIIITDSGGVQEEAPSLGKPVLVMRATTERPEAIQAGTVVLVGTDREKIVKETNLLLNDQEVYRKMSMAHNPYGDGKASARIVAFLNPEQLNYRSGGSGYSAPLAS